MGLSRCTEDESEWEASVASLAEVLRSIEASIVDPEYDLEQVLNRRGDRTAFRETLMVGAR